GEESSGNTGKGSGSASVGDGTGGGGTGTGVPGLMGMGDGIPGAVLLGSDDDHRPPYPRWARERGLEGKITLELEVLPTGRVGTVRLLESTGNTSLDEHTIRWAKEKLLFEPARLDGQPVTTFYKLSWKYELGS
ncbi:MAG: energy transducer TonB, partial [Bdellovibrionota bacterium]